MRQETDEQKQRAAIGKRAGLVGLLCNFLLAGGKLAVGTLAASMAIFADGLNNLSDGASSLVTLLGFKLGERPADPEHPYGHARYEYLAALTVAVMILVIGVELGAALKNVIALCAGITDGLGCGDNTKAMLMTRGLTETARLGVALGAHKETFTGLAGVGDLIVTCTSMHSRNRRAGILIGQGKDPQTAMKEVGAVVEGYYATKAAYELGKQKGIDMPITSAAYAVLYEGADVAATFNALMTRHRKAESEDTGWM